MTELDKLEKYLKANGYNYHRHDEPEIRKNGYIAHCDRHQILVYDEHGNLLWDAICQRGSYGYEKGLLEIMGKIVSPGCDVEGWLNAQQIIHRLENGLEEKYKDYD